MKKNVLRLFSMLLCMCMIAGQVGIVSAYAEVSDSVQRMTDSVQSEDTFDESAYLSSSPEENYKEPHIVFYVTINGISKKNFCQVTDYSCYSVGVDYYDGKNKIPSDVTAQCNFDSFNSENEGIATIEDGCLKTYGKITSVTLNVSYNGYSSSCGIDISHLTSVNYKDELTYAGLSYVSYTDFSKDNYGKSIRTLLDEGIALKDGSVFINNTTKQGATFNAFYAATIEDWIVVEQYNLNSEDKLIDQYYDGFVATTFRKGNQYVIAYRGTEIDTLYTASKDIWSDVYLGLGKTNSQVQKSTLYYDSIYESIEERYRSNIVLTGHSLGGGLANAVSVLRGNKAYTFNAPSTMITAFATDSVAFSENYHGLNDGLRMDFVNENDATGNTGMGDNYASNITGNVSFLNNFTLQMFGKEKLDYSDKGGLIDTTTILQDQSSNNGKGDITPYHFFAQLIHYDNWKSISFVTDTVKNPSSYYVDCAVNYGNVRQNIYFGSIGSDNKTFTDASISVFGGDGDDVFFHNPFLPTLYKKYSCIVGGKGNDTIGGTANDTIYYTKGDGIDTLYYTSGTQSIYLYGFSENSKISFTNVGSSLCELKVDGTTIMYLTNVGQGKYKIYKEDTYVQSCTRTKSRANYYYMACPVNMVILDSAGNTVLTLRDGEEMSQITEYGSFHVTEIDGEYIKTASIYNEEYTVKLEGIGEGTMDYSCSIFDGDNVITRKANNIEVHLGSKYTVICKNDDDAILHCDINGDGSNDYDVVYTAPTQLSLSSNELSLDFADTLKLTATVLPIKASQSVLWCTSDAEVAVVDEDGNVIAIGPGSATITAYCEENDTVYAECTINVSEKTFSLKNAKITGLESTFEYNGDCIVPTVTVQYKGIVLREGIDYTVVFQNNILPGTATVTITGCGMFTGEIQKQFTISAATNATIQKKAQQIVEECLNTGLTDPYDIALWLHDWLINNANYDYSYSYYSADGVLLHKTGVCQSYTLAYQLLLNKAGIENKTIVSSEMNHTWNIVKINNTWTHIDCTWDDPGTGGYENHQYFAVGDDVMEKDHTWDHSKYPACYTITQQVWAEQLTDPYDLLSTPVEGIDYIFSTVTGEIISFYNSTANKDKVLLIFGRPTCSNTMSLIREITPWKDVLDDNGIQVYVIFESKEQVEQNCTDIPFECVYCVDNHAEMWDFLYRVEGVTCVSYPMVVAQDGNGYAHYYSTGYVQNPKRLLATLIQYFPQTEKKIDSIPTLTYTTDADLTTQLRSIMKYKPKGIKVLTEDTSYKSHIGEIIESVGNEFGASWDHWLHWGSNWITYNLTYNSISVIGVIESYNPQHATTVSLVQNGKVKYSTVIAAEEGSGKVQQFFNISGIAAGTYDLVVTKIGHLTYTVTGIVVANEDVNLTKASYEKNYNLISLLAGDVNGDGKITSDDINIIWKQTNYQKDVADSEAGSLADVDGSGTITSDDINIIWKPTNYQKGIEDCTVPY